MPLLQAKSFYPLPTFRQTIIQLALKQLHDRLEKTFPSKLGTAQPLILCSSSNSIILTPFRATLHLHGEVNVH